MEVRGPNRTGHAEGKDGGLLFLVEATKMVADAELLRNLSSKMA